jgi:hypothetical protein
MKLRVFPFQIFSRLEFSKWKELRQSKQETLQLLLKKAVVVNARHLASQLARHLVVLLTSSAKTAKANKN